jgi:hypothetical protein
MAVPRFAAPTIWTLKHLSQAPRQNSQILKPSEALMNPQKPYKIFKSPDESVYGSQ